ncbi:uncharacterized protein LOC131853325 [Achroia grisella]|uniref:uncharacterized protein LOC131853325 n=1 Tax=Achroia grisella TaxID=688607 RepID=UPI0027D2EBBA|nr:uncharacterized protein LOC131853325 [Achroia grisella]
MKKNIINTLTHGERVTSAYTEIYFDDSYSEICKSGSKSSIKKDYEVINKIEQDEWKSPSDKLIGILELEPPFTSKITRGKTHQGILEIGNGVLEAERNRILKKINGLIKNNDAAWTYILEMERNSIDKNVQSIYKKILKTKSKIMSKEIAMFYENTLQELEDHMRAEIKNVLSSVHAYTISASNIEIKIKLKKERLHLVSILKKKHEYEIEKVKKYYKLLLHNELHRNNKLVNEAIQDRNDTLKSYVRQIDCENKTSTMYIMCTERKKCKIKKVMLQNYQMTEISEKIKNIKDKQGIINDIKDTEVTISEINNRWEEKIKKILQLFLKFIGFSLKLLPEQSTFLLDFEKMVVLQLNEIQKLPEKSHSILVEEENLFNFSHTEALESQCDKQPFVVAGDISELGNLSHYGSRETLPSNVDLPIIRVQRQFIYAKCQKYEEIKAFLESEQCKCLEKDLEIPLCHPIATDNTVGKPSLPTTVVESDPSHTLQATISSNEPMIIDDFKPLRHCPMRNCKNWAKMATFPYLESYLDYTDDNFERLKMILYPTPKKDNSPALLNHIEIVCRELPFGSTSELYCNVGTQYSSQELSISNFDCLCTKGFPDILNESHYKIKESSKKSLNEILMKRKSSLRHLLQENPKLLKMFTDESFDFQF